MTSFTTRWDDHFQNWAGRLRWLERYAETPEEFAEKEMLYEARDLGYVVIEKGN